MQFTFAPAIQEMLNSVIGVTSCMGYRAQDLRITATKGFPEGYQLPEKSKANGMLRFEFAAYQSFAEFEVPSTIETEGVVVTNSYFINQLPFIPEGMFWDCKLGGDRLLVTDTAKTYKFDFLCAAAEGFKYDPTYCESNINIEPIAKQLSSLSRVIAGFVNAKQDTTEEGAIKICGTDIKGQPTITFEATNLKDAIYGEIPVEAMPEKWDLLIPLKLFASWNNLPLDKHPISIGTDARYQLTLRCGPITIQHNTLSNLLNKVNDVAAFAGLFAALGNEEADEFSERQFEMMYVPSTIQNYVNNATIYADGDPSLKLEANQKGETYAQDNVDIEVRAINTDSNVKVASELKVAQDGRLTINRSSLALINRIQELAGQTPDPKDPQTWMLLRANSSIVFAATPDLRWLAVSSQTNV